MEHWKHPQYLRMEENKENDEIDEHAKYEVQRAEAEFGTCLSASAQLFKIGETEAVIGKV